MNDITAHLSVNGLAWIAYANGRPVASAPTAAGAITLARDKLSQ